MSLTPLHARKINRLGNRERRSPRAENGSAFEDGWAGRGKCGGGDAGEIRWGLKHFKPRTEQDLTFRR
jgi:hypothetical protein